MRPQLVLWLVILAPSFLRAQGTFQNLDFEQASIVPLGAPYDPHLVDASAALPGWTAYIGGSSVNSVVYDTVSLGSPDVSIQDSLSPFPPLQGNYSVVLQHSGIDSTTAGIGQTGQLPQNVAAIIFCVEYYQPLQVTFAGDFIPVVELGMTANYSIYGGNIAPYAGQTGQLLFTDIGTGSQPMMLDDIQFSTSQIPEPSVLGLLSICLLFLCWRKQRSNTSLEPTPTAP